MPNNIDDQVKQDETFVLKVAIVAAIILAVAFYDTWAPYIERLFPSLV